MARPLRIEFDGAVYHVMARGNGGDAIFRDDHDRVELLSVIGVRSRFVRLTQFEYLSKF